LCTEDGMVRLICIKSKGLASVFSENEEAMARWLSEMAERGM